MQMKIALAAVGFYERDIEHNRNYKMSERKQWKSGSDFIWRNFFTGV